MFQAATWTLTGRAEPFEGNLRSIFYAWVKPVLARLPETHEPRVDPYEVMLEAFETFVVELGLWRYGDLDLVDERWDQRVLGDGRCPHVLVYAEKTGFMRTIKRAVRDHGVNGVALGGFPSYLSDLVPRRHPPRALATASRPRPRRDHRPRPQRR